MNPRKLGDILIVRAQHKEINTIELEECMHHLSHYVRSSVAIALGYVGGDKSYELLERLMEDPEELVAGDAIISSGKFGDRCLQKLEEKYRNGTFQIKTRVINTLDGMESQKARGLMYKFQNSEEHPKLKKILDGMLQ